MGSAPPATKPRSGVGTIAVTGSKGGVGKSNLVLNLAVALARWGRRVLLVDGDLGLANIDVLLGLMPHHTIEHLMRGEVELDDVLIEGPGGVRILPAASGVPRLASLDDATRRRVLSMLAEISGAVDDVLVDTGAGLGDATLSLQLAASRVVLVTTPEPTSLVDSYATLKVLWSADPRKSIDLVVNAAQDDDEATRVFEQIAKATRHFLEREPGWLGPVYYDEKVPDAVRRQQAVSEIYPDCAASRCYERIALKLVSENGLDSSVTDYWAALLPEIGEEVRH